MALQVTTYKRKFVYEKDNKEIVLPDPGTNIIPDKVADFYAAQYPELLKQKDKKSEPTCSMAESLKHQSLFINSMLAQYAAHLLWGLWNNLGTDYQGLYLNLKTLQTSKIEIK